MRSCQVKWSSSQIAHKNPRSTVAPESKSANRLSFFSLNQLNATIQNKYVLRILTFFSQRQSKKTSVFTHTKSPSSECPLMKVMKNNENASILLALRETDRYKSHTPLFQTFGSIPCRLLSHNRSTAVPFLFFHGGCHDI